MGWVVVVLLIVVIIFGVSASAQSYATAQQAQAQIEVAQVGQINAWGNLVTILIVGLVVLLVLAVIAVIAWLMLRRAIGNPVQPSRGTGPRAITSNPPAAIDMNQMIALLILEILESRRAQPQLPARAEDRTDEEPLSWLQLK